MRNSGVASMDQATVIEKLEHRISELEEQLSELKRQLEIDPKSKIYNSRGLDRAWGKTRESYARAVYSLTIGDTVPDPFGVLIMIDINSFKKVNDHFGHLMGDRVLQSLAQSALERIRNPEDIVARLGERSDEFVLYLHQVTKDTAVSILKDIHESMVLGICITDEERQLSKEVLGQDHPASFSYGMKGITRTSIHWDFDLLLEQAEARNPKYLELRQRRS